MVKEDHCRVEDVTEIINKHLPNDKVKSQNIGSELTYFLPGNSSHLFPDLLDDLEKNMKRCGISSYGISISNIEEVRY